MFADLYLNICDFPIARRAAGGHIQLRVNNYMLEPHTFFRPLRTSGFSKTFSVWLAATIWSSAQRFEGAGRPGERSSLRYGVKHYTSFG